MTIRDYSSILCSFTMSSNRTENLDRIHDGLQLYGEKVNIEVSDELKRALYDIEGAELRYQILRKTRYYGNTILHDAAFQGQTDLFKILLYSVYPEHRVKLLEQLTPFRNTVFDLAALNDHTGIIRVAAGSIAENRRFRLLTLMKPNYGTPLHSAAYRENASSIETLLQLLPIEQ